MLMLIVCAVTCTNSFTVGLRFPNEAGLVAFYTSDHGIDLLNTALNVVALSHARKLLTFVVVQLIEVCRKTSGCA
jgi:hypothetical protein